MSEKFEMFDVIVIGAGIMGSCTAYQLAKNGQKVLLLEQFTLGHSHGSSHGASRIIRYAHTDDIYLPLAKLAYQEWDELAQLSDEKLYKTCGLVWVSDAKNTKQRAEILSKNNIEHEVLKGDEIGQKFPHLKYDSTWHAIYDPKAGFVYADRALKAAQSQFLKFGGKIIENEKIIRIDPRENVVEIYSSTKKYLAKKIVVTAGGWLREIFSDLDIQAQPELIGLTFWKILNNHKNYHPENNSPVMIMSDNCDELYMIPEVDYPGEIKFGVHFGLPIKADDKDKLELPQWTVDFPAQHIKDHFKDVDWMKPTRKISCMYTVTKDHNYILDVHPKHPNVIIGGGFSGSGFKFGAIIGKILTRLVLEKSQDGLDLSPFRISRHILESKCRL